MFFDLNHTRLVEYLPIIIWPAVIATLKMLIVSALLGLLIGTGCAVILVITRADGLAPHRVLSV